MTGNLLHRSLENSSLRLPHKVALRHNDTDVTYDSLVSECRSAAAVLTKIPDSSRGDRIAVFMEKSIEQVIWIYAASMADRVFVLLADQLKDNQIEHILKDCNVSVLVHSNKFSDVAQQMADKLGVVLVSSEERSEAGLCIESKAITDDIATIIYTSGSTGRPKGIVITHRNLLDGIDSVSEYLDIQESDRLIAVLPFNFDYGLNQLTSALAKGASVVLHHFFVPGPMLKLIARERITGFAAIPTIWAAVFNARLTPLEKIFEENDFSALRYITNSGGKLPVPVVRRIGEMFPHTRLFLMYGLTEAFRSTYLDPEEVKNRPDSIGKAIPGVQVEVVREDGSVCEPDETGELIHRGALIARGYWNNPEKTAEVYRPNPLLPPENRFLETVVYSGDLVKKDDQGFLYYVGRKDNMIKISGYRVSPTEVEEILISSGLVVETVVFGVADDELGYRIRAVIVFKGSPDIDSLREYCRKTAPSYLVPQDFISAEFFPKTASGKIDRPAVQKEYGLCE